MRLIDADKLLSQAMKGHVDDYMYVKALVDNQPTAYDVDEVVEQMKEEGCIIDNDAGNRAVEIVKGAIKDE